MYKSKIGWVTHENTPFYIGEDSFVRCDYEILNKIKRNIKTTSSVLVHGSGGQWTDTSEFTCTSIVEACKNSPHLCYLLTNDTTAIPEIVRLWQIERPQEEWPANVWLGFTATDQKSFDKNWAMFTDEADGVLGRFPDVNVFVEYKAVGELVLPENFTHQTDFNWDACKNMGNRWLIASGEKGKSARPPHPKWLSDIKNQCLNNGVMFYFDGWGEFRCLPKEHFQPFNESEYCYSDVMWDTIRKPRGSDKGLLFGKEYKATPLGEKYHILYTDKNGKFKQVTSHFLSFIDAERWVASIGGIRPAISKL